MSVRDEVPRVDEIDLYPYWLRIRKHGVLLITLALVVAVAAGLVSSYCLPKIYRVNAAISLGRIEEGGKVVEVASVPDIRQLIDMGSFNKKVLSSLKLDGTRNQPNLSNCIEVESTEGSENAVLSYDSPNPEQAVKILRELIMEIQRVCNPRIGGYRRSKEAEMVKSREAVKLLEYKRDRVKLDIDNLTREIEKKRELAEVQIAAQKHDQARIADQLRCLADRKAKALAIRARLDNLSVAMEGNTRDLLKGKADLARGTDKGGTLASILFANNVQQNIGLLSLDYERIQRCDLAASEAQEQADNLTGQMKRVAEDIKTITITAKADIRNLELGVELLRLQQDKEIPAEIRKAGSTLDRLEAERDMATGIEIMAPPDFLNRPVKPDPQRYAAGAGALSLIMGLFLAIVVQGTPSTESAVPSK